MSTSSSAMEANFVQAGVLYVPEPLLALFLQLFQSQTPSSTAIVPGIATVDKNPSGFPEPSMAARPSSPPASQERTFFSSPSADPATSAAPSPTLGNTGGERHDVEGGSISAAAGREAPPAAPRAEDGGAPLPALPSRARGLRLGSHRRGRTPAPCLPEPISVRALDSANGSAGMDAPAISSKRCATCGTPGVRTEAWVCGVCDAPFTFRGEPVLSLDGLDAELAAGGLYCESCDELRPPFERLACTGCSAPMRHIADVLDPHGRERGSRVAEASVDAPLEPPDDGITTDSEIETLLPRESAKERRLLEQDLLAHGCVSPLVVWQDGPRQVLLDGHIRHAICQAHHIPFEKKILEFPDRASAIRWVLMHQLGRRNLTPEAQAYLRGRIYNLEKRQGARTDLSTSRQRGEKLSELLADFYRVGRRTIERDGRFAAHLDHLAAVYGAAIKNAVLARDAKMTRGELARAVRLDALSRGRILARAQQGEAAVDVIHEALQDRRLNDRLPRRAHAAEAAEDVGEAAASTSPGKPRGRAEEPPDNAPPSFNAPGAHDAGDVGQHPVAVAVRRLEIAVHNLKQGELSPVDGRRLERWLSEIQQTLAALSKVRAGQSQPHTPAALAGDGPARVTPAIEVARG